MFSTLNQNDHTQCKVMVKYIYQSTVLLRSDTVDLSFNSSGYPGTCTCSDLCGINSICEQWSVYLL